jgi:predicted  nucleic acid-binding Zn-ribbon protein
MTIENRLKKFIEYSIETKATLTKHINFLRAEIHHYNAEIKLIQDKIKANKRYIKEFENVSKNISKELEKNSKVIKGKNDDKRIRRNNIKL